MKLKMVMSLAVFFAFGTSAFAATTCTVDEKQSCSAGTGCQPIENSIIVRIDWKQGTYSRCDAKGCDDLKMNFAIVGEFINVDVPGRGMLAKMSKDGSSYVEVATLMTTVLMSFGRCEIQ